MVLVAEYFLNATNTQKMLPKLSLYDSAYVCRHRHNMMLRVMMAKWGISMDENEKTDENNFN